MSESADKEVRIRGSRKAARNSLEKQYAEGLNILAQHLGSSHDLEDARRKHDLWWDYTAELLLKLFTTNRMKSEFCSAAGIIVIHPSDEVESRAKEFRELLGRYVNKLKSIIDRLELLEEDVGVGITSGQKLTRFFREKVTQFFKQHPVESIIVGVVVGIILLLLDRCL